MNTIDCLSDRYTNEGMIEDEFDYGNQKTSIQKFSLSRRKKKSSQSTAYLLTKRVQLHLRIMKNRERENILSLPGLIVKKKK